MVILQGFSAETVSANTADQVEGIENLRTTIDISLHQKSARQIQLIQVCKDENPDSCSWHKDRKIKKSEEQKSRLKIQISLVNNAIVRAEMLAATEDGAAFHQYYFRPDGTLALIDTTELNDGNIYKAQASAYYDKSGQLISKKEGFVDSDTGRPVQITNYQRHPIPFYSTTAHLIQALGSPDLSK